MCIRDRTGTVHSLPDTKGNLMVQMGILSSKVHISDLEIVDEKPAYLKKLSLIHIWHPCSSGLHDPGGTESLPSAGC